MDGAMIAKMRNIGEACTSANRVCVASNLAGAFADLLADRAHVMREEIFRPVAPICTFDDERQAIEWANRTEYGLVADVYTRDLGRAIRVSEALEAGMIGPTAGIVFNPAAPFGGVKQSGIGREGGSEGIHECLETKYVAVNW